MLREATSRRFVNPKRPKCPSCGTKAKHSGSHSVGILSKGIFYTIGWWSGWYCSKCGISFCHHPACQLEWCIKAKELEPNFMDLLPAESKER